MINIKPLGQRDTRWAGMRLGNRTADKDSSIGKYGCLLTCITMLANYYTEIHNWTPSQVNYLLEKEDGFWHGNEIIFGAAHFVFPEIKFDGFIECKNFPAPIPTIDTLLPVILKVDFNIQTGPIEGHYVLATQKIEAIPPFQNYADYLINDPWTGKEEHLLKRYAKPNWDLARAIFRVVKFSRSNYGKNL